MLSFQKRVNNKFEELIEPKWMERYTTIHVILEPHRTRLPMHVIEVYHFDKYPHLYKNLDDSDTPIDIQNAQFIRDPLTKG